MSTLGEFLADAARRLGEAGVDEGNLVAAWLAAEGTGIPRLELPLHANRMLSRENARELEEFLRRLLLHEPLQYVLGHTSFLGDRILTDRRVLIPRPETEVLVEKAGEFCAGREEGVIYLADIGTGSGCIAIALARRNPGVRLVAVDISPGAVLLAKENIRRHRLEDRVTVLEGDLLAGVGPAYFEAIVANLPYVSKSELESLPRNVADFEPRVALDGGPAGLDLFYRLVPQAATRLVRSGRLFLEIGEEQAGALRRILLENGFQDIRVHQDLAGRERVVEACVRAKDR